MNAATARINSAAGHTPSNSATNASASGTKMYGKPSRATLLNSFALPEKHSADRFGEGSCHHFAFNKTEARIKISAPPFSI
jgi:hypothetical protein